MSDHSVLTEAAQNTDWLTRNQALLVARLQNIRAAVERGGTPPPADGDAAARPAAAAAAPVAPAGTPQDSTIAALQAAFALTEFETDVLLLSAATELDGSFVAVLENQGAGYATFSLALALLANPHWSALAPDAPLRHWRLLTVDHTQSLTTGRLRVDERILHYLTGVACADPWIAASSQLWSETAALSPSQLLALSGTVRALANHRTRFPCAIRITGADPTTACNAAAHIAQGCGAALHRIDLQACMRSSLDRSEQVRLWNREWRLTGAAILLESEPFNAAAPSEFDDTIRLLVEQFEGPVFVSGGATPPRCTRPWLHTEIAKPTRAEQRAQWLALGVEAAAADTVSAAFDLPTHLIRSAFETASANAQGGPMALWDACRMLGRESLDRIAQRVSAPADPAELVLPERANNSLRLLVAHIRNHDVVHRKWGFVRSGPPGTVALFHGPSGTGKTMAAAVVAQQLNLDLYRVDVPALVSKYIGETEKNLERAFRAAEYGGSLLLFDEADALFGRRSAITTSHDRYANIEVSYLLQRLDSFTGVTVLTTNMRDSIDSAFSRRFFEIIEFPFPDEAIRRRLWARAFPVNAPMDPIDIDQLAGMGCTPASIRKIATHAAYLAADAQTPIGMRHLRMASEAEFRNLGLPLALVGARQNQD